MKLLADFFDEHKHSPELSFIKPFLYDHPDAELFFVGGGVRDILSGQTCVDFDFVVRNLEANKIESWFSKNGTVELVGKSFGVFKFFPRSLAAHAHPIDIALPRTESSVDGSLGGYRDFETQSDSTLPIEKDLERRDFTVNAMAFNLRTNELIDPFHGQEDLASKTLRAVGNPADRFQEDLTRILRGLRFAVTPGFTFEPHTWEAMRKYIPHLNVLRSENGDHSYVVARERIGNELSKAFFHDAGKTASLLLESGALEELFPGVWRCFHVDAQYLDPILNLKQLPSTSDKKNILELSIVLLLRGLTEQEVRTTLSFTGLDTIDKTSNRRIDTEHIVWMIQKLQQQLTPQTISTMRASHFEKQFLGMHGTQHLRALEHLGHTALLEAAKKRRAEICLTWNCEEHEPIPALVTGEDIVRQGIPQGPRVRELLEQVRDNQLDGKLMTREAALRFIKMQME